MAKVSVIIPVYNVEKYLKECLDSVVNQTLKDIEIICVDDGSTDNSGAILDEYASKDSRIKVVHNENKGVGNARNTGLGLATGDYIYFLDSDDYIELNALEKLYNKSIELNLDICVCMVKELNINTSQMSIQEYAIYKPYLPNKNVFSSYDVKNTIFHLFIGWIWDKLYKKSIILDNHLTFPEFKNSEDTAFTYMALILANRISTIQDPLIIHRINITTSISVNREKEPEAFISAMELLKTNLNKIGKYKTFENGFLNYFITFSKWHLDTISETYKDDLYIKIKKYYETNIRKNCHYKKLNNYTTEILYLYKNCSTYEQLKKLEEESNYNSTFKQNLFSIKNSKNNGYKIITIFGCKIKIKKRK